MWILQSICSFSSGGTVTLAFITYLPGKWFTSFFHPATIKTHERATVYASENGKFPSATFCWCVGIRQTEVHAVSLRSPP